MRRLAILGSAIGAGGLLAGLQLPVLAASRGGSTSTGAAHPALLPSALGFLADPTLAFGLLLLALLGLGLELVHPGALFPGVVGLVAGVLAVGGLLDLPTNILGLLLVALAVALFTIDIAAPTHGLLSAAGVGTAIAGGVLLFRGPGVNLIALLALPLALGAIWVFLSTRALRVRRQSFPTTPQELLGLSGVVRERAAPYGLAEVGGELWRVVARDDSFLETGSEIEVLAQDGLTLIVRLTAFPVTPGSHSEAPRPLAGRGAQQGGTQP